jgi:protein-tyrosine phosphatase
MHHLHFRTNNLVVLFMVVAAALWPTLANAKERYPDIPSDPIAKTVSLVLKPTSTMENELLLTGREGMMRYLKAHSSVTSNVPISILSLTYDPVDLNGLEPMPENVYHRKIVIRDAEDETLPIKEGVAFIRTHLAHGRTTIVHCEMGVSRSSSIVLAYLMKYHRMSLEDAFAFLRQRRPFVKPNAGFWRQLQKYERILDYTHD